MHCSHTTSPVRLLHSNRMVECGDPPLCHRVLANSRPAPLVCTAHFCQHIWSTCRCSALLWPNHLTSFLPATPRGFRPSRSVEEFLYAQPGYGPSVLANATLAINAMPSLALDRGHAIAIHAYTQESPLYKDLCAAMRSEDPAAWEPYADYIYHLQNAIIMLPARGPGRVYRGINKRMPSRVYSGNITWQAFSSTTYNPMSMAPFCGLDEHTYAITGTIFVIDLKGSRCNSSAMRL